MKSTTLIDQILRDGIEEGFHRPLTLEELHVFSEDEQLHYVSAMCARLSENNPLYLSVEEVTDLGGLARRVVGLLTGGFNVGKGKIEVLTVPRDARVTTIGALLFRPSDVAGYLTSIVLPGEENKPEGIPNFRGKTLLVHSDEFCLRYNEVDVFDCMYAMPAGDFRMAGPAVFITRNLTMVRLSDYTLVGPKFDWVGYLVAKDTTVHESAEAPDEPKLVTLH